MVDFYLQLLQGSLSVEEVSRINNIIACIRNATLSAKSLKNIKHDLDSVSNTASDNFYGLYKKIYYNQHNFYNEFNDLVVHFSLSTPAEIEKLHDIQTSSYKQESEDIYHLFALSKHHEVDISSLLNMVREINNSNEAILRSLQYILEKK